MSEARQHDPPAAPASPLTPRQREVLAAIAKHIDSAGYPPSIRDLQTELGIASSNGMRDHLVALERKGCLIRSAGVARGLVVTDAGHTAITGAAG